MISTRTKLRKPVRHGQSRTRLYAVWNGMKHRCVYSKVYGGYVAIGVDAAWAADFLVFRDWAIANGYQPGLALNRINKARKYEPSNCRFSESYSRSHGTPVIRGDGKYFESLAEAVRGTPRVYPYGIWLVCEGRQGKCGNHTWRYARSTPRLVK